MADALLDHRGAGGADVVAGHAEDQVARHEIADLLREHRLVLHGGADDVALGEHAHRPPALVDDDERADVVLGEHPERLPDRLLRPDRDDFVTLGGEDAGDVHGGLLGCESPDSADALDLSAISGGPPPAA